MTAADQTTPGADSPAVLAPYANAQRGGLRRRVRTLMMPGVILFCLVLGVAFGLVGPVLPLPFAIPIVVLAGLVIWALPNMARAPTRSLEACFWAFFVILIMWPNYLAVSLPGLPWITVLRVVDIPLVALLLVCISVSPDFRKSLAETLSAAPGIWKFLAGFTLIAFLSIGFSKHPFTSVQRFIVAQTGWTAVFVVSCYVFSKKNRATYWAASLWAMAILVGLIAIWEHHLEKLPWVGHIPGILKINDPDVERILAGQTRAALELYRTQSTFTTAVGLAEFLALTLPFLIHFAVGPFRWTVRLAACATMPFMLVIILYTNSRLGMIGLIMSAGLSLLAWGAVRWRSNPRSIFGPAITLGYPVIGVVILASTFLIGHLHAVVWGNGYEQASNQSRIDQLHAGIPMVLSRPWGHGIGMAASTLGYTNADDVLTIDTYYLSVALEYGLVGFVVYFGMFILAIWYAGKYAALHSYRDREYSFLVPATISLVIFVVV